MRSISIGLLLSVIMVICYCQNTANPLVGQMNLAKRDKLSSLGEIKTIHKSHLAEDDDSSSVADDTANVMSDNSTVTPLEEEDIAAEEVATEATVAAPEEDVAAEEVATEATVAAPEEDVAAEERSEERRVGKEC